MLYGFWSAVYAKKVAYISKAYCFLYLALGCAPIESLNELFQSNLIIAFTD